MTDIYALTTTVKGYSAGTRVTLQNQTKAGTYFIQVNYSQEVLEVAPDEIVKLRPRARTVTLGKSAKEKDATKS